MARPTEKTLKELRDDLAVRLGYGGMAKASINKALLNSFLINAQEELWERLEMTQVYDEVEGWVGPDGRIYTQFPSALDPDRLRGILVDYSGNADWRPLFEGIDWDHDSTVELDSHPRRYELHHDNIKLWPRAGIRDTYSVTAATQADPCVVTVNGTPNVEVGTIIKFSGVGGMTQLNDNYYQVLAVSTNQISLGDEFGANIDATGYGAFTSGGTLLVGYKLKFEGYRRLEDFAADGDRATLPSNLVFLQALADAKLHYNHKDAPEWRNRAKQQLTKYRGRIHGNRRYVPAGKGRVQRTEMIKPGRVD